MGRTFNVKLTGKQAEAILIALSNEQAGCKRNSQAWKMNCRIARIIDDAASASERSEEIKSLSYEIGM